MPDFKQLTPEAQKENKTLMGAFAIVVVVVALLAIAGFLFLNKPDEIIEGQADATAVRISGKLPGRVVDLYVEEGDMVKAGDPLVHIHSSLADAKLVQAMGMETAAKAMNRKVDAGTRSQIIQSARRIFGTAAHAITAKLWQATTNRNAARSIAGSEPFIGKWCQPNIIDTIPNASTVKISV